MPGVPELRRELSTPLPGLLVAKARTESTFEQIPIIDFTDATSPDFDKRRALADQILDASVNVGFFYIKNHTIPEAAIADTISAAGEFFALPLDTKMALDIHKSANFKGYTALLGENTDPEGKGDLHEGFDMGWEEQGNNAMSGTNVWPAESDLPGFRKRVLAYYQAVVRLGQLLFPLFALALDLPEDFFDDKTTKPAAIMRLLHYPPQKPAIDDDGRVIGIGAHTECVHYIPFTIKCFTILWQDGAGGLQVQNADGKWIEAVPVSGTFIINLGDQFARWTNDVFKSTIHRVTNRSGLERYSMPLFFGTDYDVLLEPLPSCVSPDYPPKYEVVTAGEYGVKETGCMKLNYMFFELLGRTKDAGLGLSWPSPAPSAFMTSPAPSPVLTNGCDASHPHHEAFDLAPHRLFDVQGLVAVITGGGSGIGRMMAAALENNGATVYIVGRRLEVLENTAREISKHGKVIALEGDVTNQDSLLSIVESVKKGHGYIDLLVNNAGIVRNLYDHPLPSPGDSSPESEPSTPGSPPPAPSIKAFQASLWNSGSPDGFAETFLTNVTSVYYTTVAFLDLLHQGNLRKQCEPSLPRPPIFSSQVLSVSSSGGFRLDPKILSLSYTLAKTACTHLGKLLANLLAPWGIRSNVIAPGVFPSEMTAGVIPGVSTTGMAIRGAPPSFVDSVPLKRAGTEEEIAGVILFLASPAGAYVNGAVWLVDGGRVGSVPSSY
uniref:2OG-Fe oxygenase n=1 Tax=Mycena chlorophos TaxID=658473 RepID=A0ABQ0LTD8_MYCCL|nr:2OG-Fe oxygenase [Mycena chlorophos]